MEVSNRRCILWSRSAKTKCCIATGYSWHTNQVGLAFDSVEAFELVKPGGEVVEVTHESDPELFFALKGGGNNFVCFPFLIEVIVLADAHATQGIVTQFTMRTFPQGLVWVRPRNIFSFRTDALNHDSIPLGRVDHLRRPRCVPRRDRCARPFLCQNDRSKGRADQFGCRHGGKGASDSSQSYAVQHIEPSQSTLFKYTFSTTGRSHL